MQLGLHAARALLFAAAVWIVCATHAAADPFAPDTALHLVGKYYAGGAHSVAVDGDLAYIGSGPYLVAADVSDPAHPVIKHRLQFDHHLRTLTLDDGRLYVGDRDGLHVVHPGSDGLMELGRVEIPSPNSIVLEGGLAYVAAGSAGLVIVDVRNPFQPRVRDRLALEIDTDFNPESAYDVVLVDGYCLLATTYGLHVIDVRNPSQAREVHYEPDVGSVAAYMSGTYLFLVGSLAVHVLDVSNPTRPIAIGKAELDDYPREIELGGERAYVATSEGFVVLDISEPAVPTVVATYAIGRIVFDISLKDGVLFLADGYSGVRMVDVADPTDLAEAGRIAIESAIDDILVRGDTAYVATGATGLVFVDVSDPASPTRIGRYGRRSVGHVSYSDGITFLAGRNISLMDLSDMREPRELGVIELPYSPTDIVVRDGTAFVSGLGGIRIYDVSNPSVPVLSGELVLCEFWQGCDRRMAIDGNVAYLLDPYDKRLRTVDVSDPENPTEVGSYDIPVTVADVLVVHEHFAYLAASYELYIIDVQNPSDPVLSNVVETGVRNPLSMRAHADALYLLDWDYGLTRLDASKPSSPQVVDSVSTDGGALRTTFVHEGLVYVAASSKGLYIFGSPNEGQGAETPQARPTTAAQAFPNPFDHEVTLEFTVLDRTTIRAAVYDLLGRVVLVLADGEAPQGTNRLRWNGLDSAGRQVPPGMYFIRVESETNRHVAPVVRIAP